MLPHAGFWGTDCALSFGVGGLQATGSNVTEGTAAGELVLAAAAAAAAQASTAANTSSIAAGMKQLPSGAIKSNNAVGPRQRVLLERSITLLEGQAYKTRTRGPKIYVYELPGNFNVFGNLARLDRPLYLLFWQRLLSSGVRTPDGDEVRSTRRVTTSCMCCTCACTSFYALRFLPDDCWQHRLHSARGVADHGAVIQRPIQRHSPDVDPPPLHILTRTLPTSGSLIG